MAPAADNSSVGHEQRLLGLGAAVVVSPDHDWAKGARGVISRVPSEVAAGSPDWRHYWRSVKTRNGSEVVYWVEFDEPQTDPDGDGPYRAAELPARALSTAT